MGCRQGARSRRLMVLDPMLAAARLWPCPDGTFCLEWQDRSTSLFATAGEALEAAQARSVKVRRMKPRKLGS